MVEFSQKRAAEALAQASAELRAAGVQRVWLDLSGTGWTGEYRIAVEATTSEVRHGIGVQHLDYYILAADTVAAIGYALAGLHLPDRIELAYACAQNASPPWINNLIWPASERLYEARQRLVELSAEIEQWQKLDR